MFNIVLISPQIPPNTGTIGRLCVNIGATLHIIKPIGFDMDDKAVKRAGLDYWDKLDLVVWENIDDFLEKNPPSDKFHFATTKSDTIYFNASFSKGDFLLFGSETTGIDEKILKDNTDRCMTIPMGDGGRSLNLAMSVGIVTYEALRQNYDGFTKITIPHRG